jgi:hypothetical protein
VGCGHSGDKLFFHGCSAADRVGPGIHALVIGVSKYQPKNIFGGGPMGDIEGTAAGAANFAHYLANDFHDPSGRPLRTVRLLLSPTDSEQKQLKQLPVQRQWQEATRENVEEALDAWCRVNDSCEDIAILYVGGHGIVTPGGAKWVFLGEAGRDNDPYRHAINLDGTDAVIGSRPAAVNLFVLDCCSTNSERLFPSFSSGISPNFIPPAKNQRGREIKVVIKAAPTGRTTFTLNAQEGTMLSAALIPLLATAGEIVEDDSSSPDRYFAITSRRLKKHLPGAFADCATRHNQQLASDQRPDVIGDYLYTGISRPIPPPEFTMSLIVDRNLPVPVTVVVTERQSGQQVFSGDLGRNGHLLPLPAGSYRIKSSDGSTAYNNSTANLDRDIGVLVGTGDILKSTSGGPP